MSLVRLLMVSRIESRQLKKRFSGAPDGVTLLFHIRQLPGVNGPISLAEPRDFIVDDRSYRETTKSILLHYVEPITCISDVADFIKAEPTVESTLPLRQGEAFAISVQIAGSKLSNKGKAVIVLELGWDQQYEKFVFPFAIPVTL